MGEYLFGGLTMKKYLLSFLVFWIFLAEKLNLEVFILGFVVSIIVFILNKDSFSFNLKKFDTEKIKNMLKYLTLLIKEIITANFLVAKVVLSPKMDISPEMIVYETKLKSDINKAILANSITLTPGTLTVTLKDNKLRVHCLKKEYIEDVIDSKFEKILLKMER